VGGVPLTGVVITDPLPAGLSYPVGSSTLPPIKDGNSLVWQLGQLDAGAVVSVTFRTLVVGLPEGETAITNRATVVSEQTPPRLSPAVTHSFLATNEPRSFYYLPLILTKTLRYYLPLVYR
jgi:hypothetical protein